MSEAGFELERKCDQNPEKGILFSGLNSVVEYQNRVMVMQDRRRVSIDHLAKGGRIFNAHVRLDCSDNDIRNRIAVTLLAENLNFREIGEILGVTRNTIAGISFRARHSTERGDAYVGTEYSEDEIQGLVQARKAGVRADKVKASHAAGKKIKASKKCGKRIESAINPRVDVCENTKPDDLISSHDDQGLNERMNEPNSVKIDSLDVLFAKHPTHKNILSAPSNTCRFVVTGSGVETIYCCGKLPDFSGARALKGVKRHLQYWYCEDHLPSLVQKDSGRNVREQANIIGSGGKKLTLSYAEA